MALFAWFRDSKRTQLKAIFEWLSIIVSEKDIVLVELPHYSHFLYFEFPLRYRDKPKKIKKLTDSQGTTFIIRKPTRREQDRKWWINILSSPEIEVLENENRVIGMPPLRWGLTDEEKKIALKIARDSLEKFLLNGESLERAYFNKLPPRFHLRSDLDVALWVGGCLRGSAVVENRALAEGIAEAAIRASRDPRFKPLSYDEFSEARIEITIMHNLRIPLSELEYKKNYIYPEKGYLLVQNGKKGWFLPAAHNALRFKNLERFLHTLAYEKAGLGHWPSENANVFIFEVDDFIESQNHARPLSLRGPIIKTNYKLRIGSCESWMRSAADWLCRIQEADGNIPPIIDPLSGRVVKQIDWPRLAFTAFALAEFGEAAQQEKYTQSAEKSFTYLKNYLLGNYELRIENHELTLAYFGELALALGKQNDSLAAAGKIINRFNNLTFTPIPFAQIASFLEVLFKDSGQFSEPLENLLKILKENFEKNIKKGTVMNLAVWAELVNTFLDINPEFSKIVADWLKSQQLPNGAFPESTSSDFVYTRGTGKIFEVLALEPEKNRKALESCLTWLNQMQYNEESSFFIPREIQPKILGAFRHDYFNQEAWIDSASHLILGGTRFFTKIGNYGS